MDCQDYIVGTSSHLFRPTRPGPCRLPTPHIIISLRMKSQLIVKQVSPNSDSHNLSSGPIAILILGTAIARPSRATGAGAETGCVSRTAFLSALNGSDSQLRLRALHPNESPPESLAHLSRRLALNQTIDLVTMRERVCQVWDAAREGFFTHGHG